MNMNPETKATRKGGLGKGLDSLLGDFGDEISPIRTDGVVTEKVSAVIKIPVDFIEPNPHQPRKLFNDEKLKELAASIKVDGVIQPLIVTYGEKPGTYILIAGERRWRASKLAGIDKVPAIVKETTSNEMLRLALIENIQRADLNIIEEAEAYAALIQDFGLTQESCASKVGKDRSTVANALRLLTLPSEIQDDLMSGRLSMGHGRAILGLSEIKKMLRARDLVIKKQLSVRQTEQLCKSLNKSSEEDLAKEDPTNPDMEYLAESLRSLLHTKVRIAGDGNRGKIEIAYFSASELERVMRIMGHRIS